MKFQTPALLLFYPVLAFLVVVWTYKRKQWGHLISGASAQLNKSLLARWDPGKARWKSRLGIAGLFFLIMAAAGPQIGTRVKPIERKGVDLVFALDTSTSMEAEDVKPSRLEKAKFEISQMIRQLKGDRVGIIVFAGSSHLYLPLTTDYEAARLFLEKVDTEMIPTQGTSLSTALTTGISAFPAESKKYKVLVLITDGEDHEGKAISVSEEASKTGIVIHTVGVGTLKGSLIPIRKGPGEVQEYKRDRQGRLVTSLLHEGILQEIADAGNGIYVRFDNRHASHKELLEAIAFMEKRTINTHEFSQYENRYQLFAFGSLFFFLAGFLMPTYRDRDETWRSRSD